MKIKKTRDLKEDKQNVELNEYRTKGSTNKPKNVNGANEDADKYIKQTSTGDMNEIKADVDKGETPEEQKQIEKKAKKGFVDHNGIIESALDDALKAAKRAQKNSRAKFTNVALAGEPGSGKTSRFYAWCEEQGINPLYVDVKNKDATDFAGIFHADDKTKKTQRYSTNALDPLDRPNSVLFLDEFNRGYTDVRGTLLTLIADHKIEDEAYDNHIRTFPNFLFTVIAYNPASTDDSIINDIGTAEGTRFERVNVPTETSVTYNYYIDNYTNLGEEAEEAGDEDDASFAHRVVNLVNALFSSSVWKNGGNHLFDTPEEKAEIPDGSNATNARTLEYLLNNSEGYKDKFLNKWDRFCNPNKKELIVRALANYKEVDDEANNAIHNGPKKHEASIGEKVREYLNNL